MAPAQTLGKPIRATSSSTAGPPRAFSATAARPVRGPSRKTPVRSSTGWHTPAKEIIETLALVAEGGRVSSLSRVKGYKEETIRNWLQQAAEHVERVEDVLMQEYEIAAASLMGSGPTSGTSVGHKDREEQGKEGKKNRLTMRRGSIGVRQWSKQIRGSALDEALARPKRRHRKRFSGR